MTKFVPKKNATLTSDSSHLGEMDFLADREVGTALWSHVRVVVVVVTTPPPITTSPCWADPPDM